jgi:hypothetical protein
MVGMVVAVCRGVVCAELIGKSLAEYRTFEDMLSLPRAPRFAQVGHCALPLLTHPQRATSCSGELCAQSRAVRLCTARVTRRGW